MIKVGIIGYGYWGPNVARNFNHAGISEVVAITDKRTDCLNRARQAFPQAKVTKDCDELLTSPEIDVIAVVTPVWTHYELAKTALNNGKHIFVEKPFTANVAQAEELIELAAKKKLQIMVDHTFLFTGAVQQDPATGGRGRAGQSLITTTPRASTWDCSSTISTSSGIWRRTIFPSWTT